MHYQTRSGLLPTLTTAVAVIFCSALANVSQAGVTLNGDGRVIQITDIIIPGANYTADITYNASYDDLFTDVGDTPTFFGDSATAETVAGKMLAQSQAAWGSDPIQQSIIVPYALQFFDGPVYEGSRFKETGAIDTSFGAVVNSSPSLGFAKFTLTGVPEPTSLVLFGGLGALGMVGRRRRKS